LSGPQTLLTEDGARLFARSWLPDRPRAVVLLVHGLAEHSGRYEATARFFVAHGLAVHAFDHRGHGQSPGLRVHVASFEEYRRDLRAALSSARAAHPGLPLVLLGHSQGGLVALTHALRDPGGLAGLVLSSPFLGVADRSRPSPWLAVTGRLVALVRPRTLFPSGADPALLSRDPAVGAAYAADPLVSRTVSAGWFRAAESAHVEAHARAADLRVPALVLYAGADGLVDPDATARWIAKAPSTHVEAFRYHGLYHEILNGPEGDEVRARMEAWIARTLARGGASA
jgi:alpha-beta hydrolase superfamily lysophospholipase